MDGKKVELSEQSCNNDVPVRTLFLGPVKANMSDQINVYFERFGSVNSVEIEQHNDSGTFFALVEFKTDETAAAVLSSSNGMHCIDGCDIQVKAAEPWQQPDHILNALDDDCLREVLSYLNLRDLTNAANVCVRFNEQAKSVFSTKFKKLDLTECSPKIANNLLKTFGSLARSIDVESKYSTVLKSGYEIEILTMIAQCCTPMLKELTINSFSFERHLPDDVKFDAALSKLEILSLNDCYLQNSLNNLVSACGELKVLYIDCCSQIAWPIYDRCFPKFDQLEELHLTDMAGLSGHFLNRTIASNSTVKVLSMNGEVCPEIEISYTIDAIAQNLPNLLELEFNAYSRRIINYISAQRIYYFPEILRCLNHLKSLKVLKLDLNKESAGNLCSILIKNDIPIEKMQLSNGLIDSKAIQGIAQMKHLNILVLFDFDGLTDERMIRLATGLGSKLEKLHLEGSTAKHLTTIGLKKVLPLATKLSLLTLKSTTIKIDADDYKAMLAVVQRRPGMNALLIEITGQRGQVKVDEAVLLKNRNVFYIDGKNGVKEVFYDDCYSFDSEDDSDDSNDLSGYRTPYSPESGSD